MLRQRSVLSTRFVGGCVPLTLSLLAAWGASPGCSRRGAPAALPSGALARVEGTFITQGDLDQRLSRLPVAARAQYADPARRKELVDELIRTEVLVREARRRGYDQDPEYQRIIKEQLVSFLTDRWLAEQKANDIPAAEIQRRQHQPVTGFGPPQLPQVSELVVSDRKQAEKVVQAARALKLDDEAAFMALGRRYALAAEPTDLARSPRLLAAAFSLQKVGQVSEVVETERGFHVLRLRPRSEQHAPADLQEVRGRLIHERRRQHIDELVAASRARFQVERFDEAPAAGTVAAAVPPSSPEKP